MSSVTEEIFIQLKSRFIKLNKATNLYRSRTSKNCHDLYDSNNNTQRLNSLTRPQTDGILFTMFALTPLVIYQAPRSKAIEDKPLWTCDL